jgi:hypothetical protein
MVRHDSGGNKSNGKTNGTPASKKAERPPVMERIDRPSKDGTAQMAALEVDGLKGYVSGGLIS